MSRFIWRQLRARIRQAAVLFSKLHGNAQRRAAFDKELKNATPNRHAMDC
jgi:hypothetical protein